MGVGRGSDLALVSDQAGLALVVDPLQQRLEGYLSALKHGVMVEKSGVMEMEKGVEVEVGVGRVDATATTTATTTTATKATTGTSAGATLVVIHVNITDTDTTTDADAAAVAAAAAANTEVAVAAVTADAADSTPPQSLTPSPVPCLRVTRLRFPTSLTARGRFLVHEIAEKLGLFHR